MDKVIKKLYDYRISIPTEMLKSLNINKGDEIELTKVDNGILLTKKNSSNFLEPIDKIKEKLPIKEVRSFSTVKLNKRKEIYLPKELFDKYQLSGKSFSTSRFQSLSSEITCLLLLNPDGEYKFRKDNAISLKYLFPDLKLEQGQEVKVSIVNNSINLVIKRAVEPVSFTTTTYSNSKEPHIISLNKQKEHFKIRIGKAGVITIPSVVFNKYELSRAKFSYVVTGNFYSGLKLELDVNKDGTKSFRKINVFSLNEIMSPHKPVEGKTIDLDINEGNLVFSFSPDSCIFNLESEKAKDSKKCSKNKQDKNNDELIEKIYKDKLENIKKSDTTIDFITNEDLPKNEKDCYKCGAKLTSKDNSMMMGHRICNKCKMKELRELFSPIKKLAEIRERRELNDKKS